MELSGKLTYSEWQTGVARDLVVLESLSHIQQGHKYEWDPEKFQFIDYQLGRFTPELIRKIGEERHRTKKNLTIDNTLQGIKTLRVDLVKALGDAEKLLNENPDQVKDTVRRIRDLLEPAIQGLHTLELTYEKTPVKKIDLIHSVDELKIEVEKGIGALLGEPLDPLLEPVSITQPIPVSLDPVKAPPAPFLRPKGSRQQEFNRHSREDFDKMLKFVEENRGQIQKEMKEGKEEARRYKSRNTWLPWTILVTKAGDIFFHYHVAIVETEIPGKREGNYKIDKRGYVYETGEDIAKLTTKILSPAHEFTALKEEKYLKLASGLPNVVKTYAIFWEEIQEVKMQRIYQKYYSHGDLKGSLERLKGDPVKIRQILLGVIRGVAALHEKGILHRDLKPANVFLDENDIPHLGDFGFAGTVGDKAYIAGSPLYMDPRVIQHMQIPIDPQMDLWSLGMLMYQLLNPDPTKTRPWPWLEVASTPADVIGGAYITKDRMFPKPSEDDPWLHACWELLQLEPEKRPSAQALLKRLEGVSPAAAVV